MILIDLGNTRAKIAAVGATEQFVALNNSELDASLLCAEFEKLSSAKEVVISSVRSHDYNQRLTSDLKKLGYRARLIDWQDVVGQLSTDYDSRASLGIDRQLAMLGALSLSESASLAIDLGTAATIDALNEKGSHLGGVIFAGLDLHRQALLAGTDDIQINADVDHLRLFPKSTTDAVTSGTLMAWRSAVWGIRQKMLFEMPANTLTFLTGGQLELLGDHNDETISVVPDLVLKGMQYLVQTDI